MDFKKIAGRIAQQASSVAKQALKGNPEIQERLEQAEYLAKAALTDEPGKIDFSLEEVFRLEAQPQADAEDFYKTALADKKQYLFFGDTNHTDTTLHHFFFGEENARRLVEAGVKHVFVEYQPEYQDIFDECAAGKIDEEGFIKKMQKRSQEIYGTAEKIDNPIAKDMLESHKIMARAIRYWAENGVKTHCPDDRSSFSKKDLNALRDTYKLFYQALRFAKDKGTDKPVVTQRLMVSYIFNSTVRKDGSAKKPQNAISTEELKKMGEKANALNIMKKRMDDDKKLAKTIARLAGDEKSAILFGAGHGDRQNGLGDLLGKEKVLRVNLHSSPEMYAERGDILMRRKGADYRAPDYVHIVNRNKVYKAG